MGCAAPAHPLDPVVHWLAGSRAAQAVVVKRRDLLLAIGALPLGRIPLVSAAAPAAVAAAAEPLVFSVGPGRQFATLRKLHCLELGLCRRLRVRDQLVQQASHGRYQRLPHRQPLDAMLEATRLIHPRPKRAHRASSIAV